MIKKGELLLVLFNLAYIIGFTIYYLSIKNYEFMIYIGVLVVLFVAMVFLQRKVHFSFLILWMLSIWGLLHMMGGGVHWPGNEVLYKWVPVEIYNMHDSVGEFVILKFDQILHFYVYMIMTLVVYHLMKPMLRKGYKFGYAMLLAVLASMGLSVINELVEFSAVLFAGSNGVGGYFNTLLDFTFNTLGALAGALVAYWKR